MNEVDLELRLRRMGLDLITLRVGAQQGRRRFGGGGSVTRQDLINFCFDIEQMTRSGIPLLDGLRDLRELDRQPALPRGPDVVIEDMEGGKVLSQCMARFPSVFDKVFVSLVGAGEQTGTADRGVREPRRVAQVAGRARVADQAPADLSGAGAGGRARRDAVPAGLPRAAGHAAAQDDGPRAAAPDADPDLASRTSSATWWPLHFLVLPIVVGDRASRIIVRRPARDRATCWDYAKLRLPVVGPILQKIILARFANFFALMYHSGITVLDAIRPARTSSATA